MKNCHIILFDEIVRGYFLGYTRDVIISELPVWGNFRVTDIQEVSNMHTLPYTTLSLENHEDVRQFIHLLTSHRIGENIIVGRTGNITLLDWPSLTDGLKSPKGIVKIQVGKAPSELYYMKKRDLICILRDSIQREKQADSSLLHHLFDTTLFYNFERIVDSAGFSFLIRNSYEYYKENLKIIDYLIDTSFIELYRMLKVSSFPNTIVSEDAVVKNSILGNGTKVDGLVEDSIIFNGVYIEKNTVVKNSVILPLNNIKENVMIENALILGGDNRVIERDSIIGSNSMVPNEDFPGILKKGLTIVGEGVTIPSHSRVGAGCLVHGKWDGIPSPVIAEDGKTVRVS